jgi:hypothetical protein
LDEDMPNYPTDDIPFTGSLSGTHFTAEYRQEASGACNFRGGTFTGTFSDDGLHFDAVEVLMWGATGNDAVVQRHWTGSQI